MDPADALRWLVLLPGGIVLAAALAAKPLRARAPRASDAVVAFGVVAAFLAALVAFQLKPGFPLAPHEDAWLWIFWFVPAAFVLGVAGTLVRVPRAALVLVHAVAATALFWLMAKPFAAMPATEQVLRAGAAGVAAALLCTALEIRAERGGWI